MITRPATAVYAVYKGDNLLVVGKARECAEYMGWPTKTVYWYATSTYRRKVAARKNPKNYITVERLDDDDDV